MTRTRISRFLKAGKLQRATGRRKDGRARRYGVEALPRRVYRRTQIEVVART